MTTIKEDLIKEFVFQKTCKRYIFGINQYATEVCKFIEIKGFVDEKNNIDYYEGKKVIHSLSDIPHDATILSCIVEGAVYDVEEKLSKWGGKHIDYFSFVKYCGLPIEIELWNGFKESYNSHIVEYNKIRTLFNDDLSKRTFDNLIMFRLDYDISHMSIFKMNIKNQYFEPFLKLKTHGETFCDIGGFDGTTTINFISRCPQFNKVYFWEPDPESMEIAQKNLSRFSNIEFIPMGASDKKDICNFKRAGGESRISEDGNTSISVCTIDEIIKDNVTFIKMDIEGSEVSAINGAQKTILKYHPKLAICVYHKGDDFISIPRAVLKIRKDYSIHLRHYTQGVYETVMFFTPITMD